MGIVLSIIRFIFSKSFNVVATPLSSSIEELRYDDSKDRAINLLPFFTVFLTLGSAIIYLIMFIMNGGFTSMIEKIKADGIFADDNYVHGNAGLFYSFIPMAIFMFMICITVFCTVIRFCKNNPVGINIIVIILTLVGFLAVLAQGYYQFMENIIHPQIYDWDDEKLHVFYKFNNFAALVSYQTPGTVIIIAAIIASIILYIILYNNESTSEMIRNTLYSAIAYTCIVPLALLIIENILALACCLVAVLIYCILAIFFGSSAGASLDYMGKKSEAEGYRKQARSMDKYANQALLSSTRDSRRAEAAALRQKARNIESTL